MRKFLPLVLCGFAALSYSQLGATADASVNLDTDAKVQGGANTGANTSNAGADTRAGAGAGASVGATDNPNATRDAQGRENANKSRHMGERKRQKDRGATEGSSSSRPGDSESRSPGG
jgi:hypothetical protein